MKIFKKILVGLLLVAVSVSAFALTLGATDDKLEDILEYHVNADYLTENFEAFELAQQYTLAGHENFVTDMTSATTKHITGDADNKMLELVTSTAKVGLNGSFEDPTKTVVVSFRVYTDDTDWTPTSRKNKFYVYNPDTEKYEKTSPVNGCKLEVSVSCEVEQGASVSGNQTMFIMNCHPESAPLLTPEGVTANPPSGALDPNGLGAETYAFYYKSYDATKGQYVDNKLEGLTPKLQTWYTINAIFDLETNQYEVQITPDGEDTVSTGAVQLGKLTSVKGAGIYVNDNPYSNKYDANRFGSKTLLDNVFVYQGSFLRDPSLKDEKTASALSEIKTAIDNATTIEEKVRLADILNAIVKTGYELPTDAEYDTANEIYSFAKNEFINSTYVDALLDYAGAIKDIEGYYNRKDYIPTVAKFAQMFSLDSYDTWLTDFPGMKAELAESVKEAVITCNDELQLLERIEFDSKAFGALTKSYNPNNKDYNYIKEQYEAMLYHSQNAVPEYKYAYEVYGWSDTRAEELGLYVTLEEAMPIFEELKAKKLAIDESATAFFGFVSEMMEEPVLMQNFMPLYENYLKAEKLYNDGEFHPGLQNDTFDGLVEAVELFRVRQEYVLDRVKACEDFIHYVNTAKTSTFYITKLYNLDIAIRYIDDNLDEYTVENDFPGVAEAKALYTALRQELAQTLENVDAYLSAVENVKNTEGKTFAQRKADVVSALALKTAGAVEGIDGVKEANIALAEAEAYISSREGYSETLIATVNQLKSATTLSQRRSLIYIALSAKDGAEDSISGVTDAKAELDALVTAYNNDVNTANTAFSTVISNALSTSSAV